MPVKETLNYILQITDSVSTRKCALRLDPRDAVMAVDQLLDKYVKNVPIEALRRERRITSESAENLLAIQDLVYVSDDNGRLHEMFAGTTIKQGDRILDAGAAPAAELGRAGETDIAVIEIIIDRWSVGFSRNWVGFHRRRWAKHEATFVDFVGCTVERDHGPTLRKSSIRLEPTKTKLATLRKLAKRIWEADFESYAWPTAVSVFAWR